MAFAVAVLAVAVGARGDEECCQNLKANAFPQGEGGFAGFEAATGRDLRNFPPTNDADHIHIKLELTVPSMDEPRVIGRETLTFSPIGKALSTLTLDARAMKVHTVASKGRLVTFGHDGMELLIALDSPVAVGEKADVVIEYELNDPPEGLMWTPFNAAMPTRTPQIHSQGQAEANSYWFPCRDFPNDRATTEIIATVPEGFMVSSNGRLLSHEQRSITDGASGNAASSRRVEVWHWLQDKTHVSYLVSMVVGKFDAVDVGSKALPMPVYVPPGRSGDIVGTYGRTPEMVAAFEALVDEQYPWDRYAQLVVTNFNAGGMENTSATTMHDGAIIDKDNLDDFEIEGLIAHELAHQWFGDLITCNSWEHIWLNEGFATYFSGLWSEARVPAQGEGAWTGGRAAYDRSVIGWFDQLIASDKGIAPDATGMASKVYAHPGEAFRKPANPYPKGASILHMLRRRLGDDVFFKGLRLYVERHKFTTVETADLRHAMEEVSGQSLEQFFWQWCTWPGIPRLEVTMNWDLESQSLTVMGKQTQVIDGDNPAFEFTLPIVATLPDGSPVHAVLDFQGRESGAVVACGAEPKFVSVDPDGSVLAQLTITPHRPEAFQYQAQQGSTIYSRIQAVRAMASPGNARSLDGLVALAHNPSQPVFLRVEAMRAATLPDQPRGALGFVQEDRWELREAACDRLGEYGATRWHEAEEPLREHARRVLLDLAQSDSSLKVRCAAIRAMGKLQDDAFRDTIAGAFHTDSHADSLRMAALDTAAERDSKEFLDPVISLCGPNHFSRTRATAVETVARLAKHDATRGFSTVQEYLSDRVVRVQRSAGEAMVRLKDARGVKALETSIERERSHSMRRQLEAWRDSLEKALEVEALKKAPAPTRAR